MKSVIHCVNQHIFYIADKFLIVSSWEMCCLQRECEGKWERDVCIWQLLMCFPVVDGVWEEDVSFLSVLDTYQESKSASWCVNNHMAWYHLLKCLAGPEQFQPAHAALCLERGGIMNIFTSILGVECAREINITTNKQYYLSSVKW